MNRDRERGAIMVEAALYFPITIAIVMAILYLGIYKLQESYFFFQVQRAASMLAREVAYPGYDSFSVTVPLTDNTIDFSWEGSPSETQVSAYYNAYNGSLSKIYRLGLDDQTQGRMQQYQDALRKKSGLFSFGKTDAHMQVINSFLSKSVQAEISYSIQTPSILRFIGVKNQITLYAAAYQPVMNSTDLVRNVDLAVDLSNFLLKKFGLDGQAKKFIEKFNKVKDLLL